MFLSCAAVVGTLAGTAVGFSPPESFLHAHAPRLWPRAPSSVKQRASIVENEFESEGTTIAPPSASRNFPDDERYRKNRRLYTHLKVSSPVRQDLSRRQRNNSKPKVLAPAGGWPQLEAATAAGADAVYFGCSAGLNARARAANFDIAELPKLMAYLHERGLEGYMCMNVLVFDAELEAAEALVVAAAAAGVDALIIQDIGLAALVGRVAPGVPVHASTQMSVTDGAGAVFAAEALRAETVVVGRELSIADMATVVDSLRASQSSGKGPKGGARAEAFVHGAMCVSYSGQCLSSEAWGGRSANRGQCAQACRLPYGLVVDGELKELLDDTSYLLSPQDLMGLERVPDMIAAGVDTFKIEGRLKGPEYVYLTTRAYRAAVDAAWGSEEKPEEGTAQVLAAEGTVDSSGSIVRGASGASNELGLLPSRSELAQVFARGQDGDYDGLTTGYLDGTFHQSVVRGRAPKHRGLLLGEVVSVQAISPPTSSSSSSSSRKQPPTTTTTKAGSASKNTKQKERGGSSNSKRMSSGSRKEDDKEAYAVVVALKHDVRRGDGVVFDTGRPEDNELGGRVFGVWPTTGGGSGGTLRGDELTEGGSAGDTVCLTFDNSMTARLRRHVTPGIGKKASKVQNDKAPRLKPGDFVWRTLDPMLEKRVKAAIGDRSLSRSRSPLAVRVVGEVGGYLTVELTDSDGRVVTATGTAPLAEPTGSSSSAAASAPAAEARKGQETLSSEGGGDDGSIRSGAKSERKNSLEVLQQHVAKAIGALGDTPFSIGTLDMAFGRRRSDNDRTHEDGRDAAVQAVALPYVSGAEVKALRKDAVLQLLAQRAADPVERTRAGLHNFDAKESSKRDGARVVQEGSCETSVADKSEPLAPLLRAEAKATARNAVAQAAARRRGEEAEKDKRASIPSPPRFPWGSFGVLCRNQAQVEAACLLPEVTEVLVDFLEARGVPIALAAIKNAGKIAVAVSPRVIKPDEEGLCLWLLDLEADALLVRSAGLLQQLRHEKQRRLGLGVSASGGYAAIDDNGNEEGDSSRNESDHKNAHNKIRFPKWPSLRGDFSLNFANALSAAHLLDTCSLDALTPAHDLNADQLAALQMQLTALNHEDDDDDDKSVHSDGSSSKGGGGGLLEVVVHQHLPVFHTEHCVFCRFLSNGSSYKDCGHPCETSQVHLRSTETGDDHLVLADMGCRNTVFNAKAQTAGPYLQDLMASGYQRWRVELVDEPAKFVPPLVAHYAQALDAAHASLFDESLNSVSSFGRKDTCDYAAKTVELLEFLDTVPDANGRAHGATEGSLKPSEERKWSTLRPTAAAAKAGATVSSFSSSYK